VQELAEGLQNHQFSASSDQKTDDLQNCQFKPDDDIGHTVIDLEHRWFCDQWQTSEIKPIEHRPLNSKSRLAGAGSCGKLKMWVDILRQSDSVPLPPPVDITKPAPEEFQLRVVVWSAIESESTKQCAVGCAFQISSERLRVVAVLNAKGHAASASNDAISDMYFSGHLRTKLEKKVEEQEQKTDIHWRAKGGTGHFNYRVSTPAIPLCL